MFICLVLLVLVLLLPAFLEAAPDAAISPGVDQGNIEPLRNKLKPVLALSEPELLRLIPDRSGFRFVGCPNCENGAEENQITWRIERPDETFCRFCGMRYPGEAYPETGVLRVTNPLGEIQEYPYWEAPHPPPTPLPHSLSAFDPKGGYRHYFRAKGWQVAQDYFMNAAWDLAQLYFLTRDASYAHRAALILKRFADVYPGYCVNYDMPFQQKVVFPGDQGFPYPVPDYRAAKLSFWTYSDIPTPLIRAYDLIRDSGALEVGAKRRIEADLFRASIAFVRAYPQQLSNADPYILRGLIAAGRVLNDPAYIHEAVDWTGRIVRKQFFVDGMWHEGTVSYHTMTLNGLDPLFELLDGYSDPPGYTHPETGERFDNLDLPARLPILEKARPIPRVLRYPNGRVVPIHDAWAHEQRDPTASTGPHLLPGVGHAWLGRGRGAHQVQAHLHFSGAYGHAHADLLSITLFSHGNERLSDIGYTWTKHREWTACTLSHSTVMVDGQNQTHGSEKRPSDGNLLLYIPGDGNFQAVEADGARAYPGIAQTYRRMLLLIGVSPEDAYVVDLFHVRGGKRHEYTLVGDANHDGAIETDLSKTRYGDTLLPPGVAFRLPTGENVPGDAQGHNIAYAYVRNVEHALPAGAWTATFTSEAAPEAAVNVHDLSGLDARLLFGVVPSVRRAGENEGKVDDFTMPTLIQRREGRDLSSAFVSILEPFEGRPFLTSVERLPLPDPNDIALKITFGDRTDHLLITSGDHPLRTGDILLRGRIGFIRERNGTVERMILVGGTVLEKGLHRLMDEGMVRGGIVDVLRKARGDAVDGLVVDCPLLPGDRLKGLTVIVTDGAGFTYGYEVAGVSDREGRPVLLLSDDPGFEIGPDGISRHTFFPGRSWTGRNRFEIANVTTGQDP